MATPHAPSPKVNITRTERFSRVIVGSAGIVGGVLLLAGAHSVLAVVLEVLLILAGVDLLVTGARGHCPLYAKLGYVPAALAHPMPKRPGR
ncbi:MAG: hypothetical protein BGO37_13785 [Cellulomonas sp. 73-92]|uniref:YgaP family membrane protein n=1 Tax=Cellulomonas sp. 73-92 TaxID=1895740 RepID=UPI000925CFF0|nr:DUF2892 domain-containing protein [Cellulomonas sp. 73-92]OJV84614.1 MAG: hypothetical protein BGO37_13785 [Cellulomonas sp. 73-92]